MAVYDFPLFQASPTGKPYTISYILPQYIVQVDALLTRKKKGNVRRGMREATDNVELKGQELRQALCVNMSSNRDSIRRSVRPRKREVMHNS